ncbi:hypothetical protein ACHAXR_002948 [Thalassiosira sp. AJA248-18]
MQHAYREVTSEQHCINTWSKFFTMDIKNFYLMTPLKLKRCEYVRLNMSDMPADVIEHYKLKEKATPDGSISVSIKRGMYGLPQS